MQIQTIRNKKKKIFIDKLYTTASLIVLKIGCFGNTFRNCAFDDIKEYWKYDEAYPSAATFLKYIKIKSIKWYIYHKINWQDHIWNGDFIYGLATNGFIRRWRLRFPTFMWYSNSGILDIVKKSPFGGKTSEHQPEDKYFWFNVPAFCLKHTEDSASFMAGVMSGAKIAIKNGMTYARFNKKVRPYFEQWKIPIEETDVLLKYFLVSPFWVALMSHKMPKETGAKWLNLKKAYGVDIYAPVLWRTYVNSSFITDQIPYLKSRRQIMYQFKCEEGAMKRLEKLRVEKKLTELDNRIKDAIIVWSQRETSKTKEIKEIDGNNIL